LSNEKERQPWETSDIRRFRRKKKPNSINNADYPFTTIFYSEEEKRASLYYHPRTVNASYREKGKRGETYFIAIYLMWVLKERESKKI